MTTKNANGVISQPIWVRTEDYGNEWHLAEVDIPVPVDESMDTFQIAFETRVKNNNWLGFIAIDDIKIENRTCRPSGFCTFESTPRLCTWKNIQGIYI